MGLLDELNDDVAEGFGENEVLEVLSQAESTEEVTMIVQATVGELATIAAEAPEDTWAGWLGSFFVSGDENSGSERKGERVDEPEEFQSFQVIENIGYCLDSNYED